MNPETMERKFSTDLCLLNKLRNAVKIINDLKKTYGIEVLAQWVTGSHASGLDSNNSDLDVRFIYRYPLENYVRISSERTQVTIRREAEKIDIEGYEVRNFMEQYVAGKVYTVELLNSPSFIAMEDPLYDEFMVKFFQNKKLASRFKRSSINIVGAFYHYYNMAVKMLPSTIQSIRASVNAKKPIEKNIAKDLIFIITSLMKADYILALNRFPSVYYNDYNERYRRITDSTRTILPLNYLSFIEFLVTYKNQEISLEAWENAMRKYGINPTISTDPDSTAEESFKNSVFTYSHLDRETVLERLKTVNQLEIKKCREAEANEFLSEVLLHQLKTKG